MTVQRLRERVSEERIRKIVFRVLEGNALCSISTVASRDRAHINTAFFAYSVNLEIYFLSDPGSLHCRNVLRNPSMAMTIFDSSQAWDAPGRGIQLFGTCRRARGDHARRAAKAYGARFPAFRRWMEGTTRSDRRQAALLRSYAFYRFLPTRVKILDEAEFGGATFIIAAVRRRHEGRPARALARIVWQATERLVASGTPD